MFIGQYFMCALVLSLLVADTNLCLAKKLAIDLFA